MCSMTLDRVAALAASGESETLECKTTSGGRRKAAGTVCAMLNQRGGHVLFGVTPAGDVVGQQVSERTIEQIGAEVRRIEPPAFPSVERVRAASGAAPPVAASGSLVATQRRAGVAGSGRGRAFAQAVELDVRGRSGVMQWIGKRPRSADLPTLQPSGGYGSGA